MWNLNKWILLIILTLTNGYDKKCPHSSQWNFTSRSYGCLDPKIYICLLDGLKSNAAKSLFIESCGPEDISREGFKYILIPDLHQVPCAAIQYQPFTFTIDGNSQCVLSKSLCKSSGQILANNGSFFADASCRCDYTRSYDYVIPPKDPCSCKPVEEDCSCYIRKCDDDKKMVADYRCLKNVETILPEDIKCPIINRIIPPEETDTVYKIQFQSVTGSGTWSKQASVILIVVVIIFTVLIGFLFCSVPHVTSILLKSKLELSVKRKENDFVILNGDNVKIECNVKSYIPLHSVIWQKEVDGKIIQITPSMEKYEKDFGKRPSLTIHDFDAEDQGKYRCIVRNVIGMKNEIFGSCLNYMSTVGWLTSLVKVLQQIPAFHTEDMMYMTLHTYNIDLQSMPTEYNVYKEEDVTMEQYCDVQQTLIAVKWYKEGDKRTELDVSNEQYSGGVPDNPSLTVRNAKIEDAGIYVCILIYDNEETKTSPFKLKIIPQVKVYKAILEHRADKTFIRPAICDTIDTQLQENNIVVITGREGTGKSKICLELASCYEKNDYMIMKVDLSENYTIYTDIADALIIIDDEKYSQDYINDFMKHHSQVLLKRNIKVILTCGNLNLDIVRSVPEINKLKKEAFIDINSCLTAEEKEKMLNQYMKVNNIAKSASKETNFKNPIILIDLSVQVTLDQDAIKAIKNEEPWKGFPMCASLFCSNRKFLHLGEKYFTNPPRYLFEELKELYKTAKKNSNSIDTVNEYCILVYIMDNSYHQLDLNDPNLCRKLVELYQTFQFKCIPEKPGSNEDQKIAIEKAAHRMNNKYLKLHEGIYKFIHPCMTKAMFLSSDSMVPYLLRIGSLHDITEFVRSIDFTALESELVIKVDENYHHILCESLARHAFQNHSYLQNVAKYINTYWRSSGNKFVNFIFSHIEFLLFQSLGVPTGNMQPLDNDSFSAKNIKEVSVTFCKIVMLVVELTIKGRDPWIYRADTADVFILCGLVSAAMGRYATIRKILLSEFQNRIHTKTFEKLCSKSLDMYENTFFHYLMLFKQMEESDILYVNEYVFDTENVKGYTPLDIAAYLGKVNVLEDLNLKTNCTKKIRDRLKRLAESGHVKFYNENLKSKAMDRIMFNKNNDDGASSEKLQSEDADDEKKELKDESKKKEVKDESTKKKKIFKWTFSHSKNKPNKTEKHGTNNSELEFIDVLCFDDDMIKVVDFGDKMDYHAIIKLLSK